MIGALLLQSAAGDCTYDRDPSLHDHHGVGEVQVVVRVVEPEELLYYG